MTNIYNKIVGNKNWNGQKTKTILKDVDMLEGPSVWRKIVVSRFTVTNLL